MPRMTPKTRSMRLALSSLGALALLVGCAPAPGAMTPQASPQSPSQPFSVQGVVTATVENVVIETSPYHEVRTRGFDPMRIVPVSERDSLPGDVYLRGLIPDASNPDRFETASPDAEGVTHLAYSLDEPFANYARFLVAKRNGVEASRIVYDGVTYDEFTRLSFPQEASGPITVEGRDERLGLVRWSDDADVVYRRYRFESDAITPLANAKDAVVTIRATNQDGERIDGLDRDHVKLTLSESDDDGSWAYAYDTLEALGKGEYRIRLPFTPYRSSGSARFTVVIVNPTIPFGAIFYRR